MTSGSAPTFGYDGTWTDPLTGLQCYNTATSRWYSTSAQRWTHSDPSGLAPDSNPNRYVGNDPVNGTDPTGLAVQQLQDGNTTQFVVTAASGFLGLGSGTYLGTITVQNSRRVPTRSPGRANGRGPQQHGDVLRLDQRLQRGGSDQPGG